MVERVKWICSEIMKFMMILRMLDVIQIIVYLSLIWNIAICKIGGRILD